MPVPHSCQPYDSRRGRSTGRACGGGCLSDWDPSSSGRGDEGGAETARLTIGANLSSSTPLRFWCRTPTVPMSSRPRGRRGENLGVAATVAGELTPGPLTNLRVTPSALRRGSLLRRSLGATTGGPEGSIDQGTFIRMDEKLTDPARRPKYRVARASPGDGPVPSAPPTRLGLFPMLPAQLAPQR